MSRPIELHYWPTPNGWKISIALEEMGLPYQMIPVNIGAGEQFEPGFQAISPNGRMPAIVDPDGPGGEPISVFESGAILQYLGRKSGLFYPADERGRVAVDEWLFWQVGGLGPMAGQTGHFRFYAPGFLLDQRAVAYGANRYTNETHRLYGVLNRRLEGRDFVAGDYSLADMAIWPWIVPYKMHAIDIEDFPNVKAWFERVGAREAVQRGRALGEELRNSTLQNAGSQGDKARSVLFNQRAR
jgi:glutathione S-transferase/GST-like protein